MSEKWPGGFIKPIPPTPAGPYQDGAASGVWTMDQMSYWLKQGLWPIAGNLPPTARFGGNNPNGLVTYSVNLTTTGNSTTFGNLSVERIGVSTASSTTRAIFAGSDDGKNVIDYFTFSSTGTAEDFGDLAYSPNAPSTSTAASTTRGLIAGGELSNVINYITMASAGNAIDFGDLIQGRYSAGGCSSPTRGVFGGGRSSDGASNVIDYVTIASTGNATDFGDLAVALYILSASGSSTRGIFGGGFTPTPSTTRSNVIQYITIASAGNATDFGDLTAGRNSLGSASSSIRSIWGGGTTTSGSTNIIDYVTIETTGNATDFGDLGNAVSPTTACSNSHGGLQ